MCVCVLIRAHTDFETVCSSVFCYWTIIYCCVPVCVLDVSINQYAHICVYICAQLLFRLCVCVRIIVVWVVFAMQLYVFSLLVCVCVCVWCCLLCDCSFMKLGWPCFIVVRLTVSLHLATCLCIFSLGSFRGSPPLGKLLNWLVVHNPMLHLSAGPTVKQ